MRNLVNWVVATFAATGAGVGGYAFWFAIEIGGVYGALSFLTLIAFAIGTFLSGAD